MFFPVVMYACEIWTIKKAEHQRIDAFELWCWRRLLKVPWTARRSNLSILKEINPEYGGTDAEAPVLWSPDGKSWLTGKDPDTEKDWGQEEKGVTEDEMVGWHHWLKGHESEQTLGDSEGQGSLACCHSWGRKELYTTEWLNNSKDCGIWSYHFMAKRWGKTGNMTDFLFLGSQITADGDCSLNIRRYLLLGRKAMTNLDILKSRDITLPTKVHLVKAMVFLVVMYGCEVDHKESWAPKNWCFELWCWRRLLRVPWTDCKEIKPVNPKGNQPWILIGRTEAEAPIIWPPDVKNWLIGQDFDVGKDGKQKEKGVAENERVR